jgi:hypothetical protein
MPAEKVSVPWKLFDPYGRWTLYVTEYDPDEGRLFGFCRSALGPDCDELGYADLNEIMATRNRFGLGMERDKWWNGKATLKDVMEGREN